MVLAPMQRSAAASAPPAAGSCAAGSEDCAAATGDGEQSDDSAGERQRAQSEFERAVFEPEDGVFDAARALEIWRSDGRLIDVGALVQQGGVEGVLFGAPFGDSKEAAWELITALLPSLHDAGADLDGRWLMGDDGDGPSWTDDQQHYAAPLMMALYAAENKALDFLTSHGYCGAVRDAQTREPAWAGHGQGRMSPLSTLIIHWQHNLPKQIARNTLNAGPRNLGAGKRGFESQKKQRRSRGRGGRLPLQITCREFAPRFARGKACRDADPKFWSPGSTRIRGSS